MDLAKLKTELTTDPLSRGYATKTDEQAAATFAINDRQPNRDSLDTGLLAASLTRADLGNAAVTANDKDYLRIVVSAGTLPLTATIKTELGAIFPAGSTTRANLLALMKRPGNRAEELNLGGIPTASDVADAKRLP